MARASRLLTSYPELLVLSKGLVAGLRSVVTVLLLLVIVIYVFGITFVVVLRGTPIGSESFGSVPQAMHTLMVQVMCGADAHLMERVASASWIGYALFLCFVVLALLTAMNMLIGIVCDTMSTVAEESKEESFAEAVACEVANLAARLDQDKTGLISKEEFEFIVREPEITANINEMGVDIVGAVDFARFIFDQTDEISYMSFAQLISQFRGSRAATLKDVTDIRRYVTMELVALEARMGEAY